MQNKTFFRSRANFDFVRNHLIACLTVVAAFSFLSYAPNAYSQKKKAKEESEEPKLPDPEDITLQTGDGLQLSLTYYPSNQGKQAIPIVLLHDWKQTRNEYIELAKYLQKQGYAVVTPDLRGHGGSTRRRNARGDAPLDAASMSPGQFKFMVTQDMKSVKDFLWRKNNEGQLNIDKLCIVGAGMGASVALDFAAYDSIGYNYGSVYYGPLKLGRFVKALVLISPEWSFRGLPVRLATINPVVQKDIAMLIFAGKRNSKAMGEAKRIHKIFERFHPEPPDGPDKLDKQTLFLGGLDTSLQGTKLLDPRFNLSGLIADFVHRRLVKSSESQDWSWKERKFPHE